MNEACCDCNTVGEPGDLRPYGPGGAMICYPCMKNNPGREEEATRQFNMMLSGIGNRPIVIDPDSNTGIYPAAHHPILSQLIDTDPKDVQ